MHVSISETDLSASLIRAIFANRRHIESRSAVITVGTMPATPSLLSRLQSAPRAPPQFIGIEIHICVSVHLQIDIAEVTMHVSIATQNAEGERWTSRLCRTRRAWERRPQRPAPNTFAA